MFKIIFWQANTVQAEKKRVLPFGLKANYWSVCVCFIFPPLRLIGLGRSEACCSSLEVKLLLSGSVYPNIEE